MVDCTLSAQLSAMPYWLIALGLIILGLAIVGFKAIICPLFISCKEGMNRKYCGKYQASLSQTLAQLSEREAQLRASTEFMRQYADKASEADAAKSQFIANVSHNLRTPINGIMGMLSLLRDMKLPPEQAELLSVIDDCAKTLLLQINDMLDEVRLDLGQLVIVKRLLEPEKIIDRLVNQLGVLLQEKELILVTRVDQAVPRRLLGDEKRIYQILKNLVHNSAKFTPVGGGIVVQMRLNSEGDRDPVMVEFIVSDSGEGIPSDKLEEIFEPFLKGLGTTESNFEGTGLGLAIARKLVILMGGRIWAQSSLGRGSALHFTLPLEREKEGMDKANEAEKAVNLDGIKVLLVENKGPNRKLTSFQLSRQGCQVITAEDAQEAKELLYRYSESGEQFALVMVDSDLPDRQALKLVRELKSEDRLSKPVPVVGMSSQELGQMREECLAAGMTDCVSKPMEQENFLELLQLWLRVS